jgi:uncharacterized membrane protein
VSKRTRKQRELARLRQQGQLQPNDAAGQRSITVARAHMETFSGPLPHPEILARYDQIHPGAASKIIETAHSQTEHRMRLEKKAIDSEIFRANAGLAAAVSVSLSVLASGTAMVLRGHDWAGGTIITGVMVGVITAFLVGTVQRRRERQEKAKIQAAVIRGQ